LKTVARGFAFFIRVLISLGVGCAQPVNISNLLFADSNAYITASVTFVA
jgi:hypothetical protein